MLATYIDWSPFFWTWQLHGVYPTIFNKPEEGKEAKKLFADGQKMLEDIIVNRRCTARGVAGFGRRIVRARMLNCTRMNRGRTSWPFHFLRQQRQKKEGQLCRSLADNIAPQASGRVDYFGGFVVTVEREIEDFAATFRDAGDDYNAIPCRPSAIAGGGQCRVHAQNLARSKRYEVKKDLQLKPN